MSNPLYNSLNSQRENQNGNIYNSFGGRQGFQQRLSEFAQNFRRQANCSPEQMVRQMISSGQMTQEQFNQLGRIANMLVGR